MAGLRVKEWKRDGRRGADQERDFLLWLVVSYEVDSAILTLQNHRMSLASNFRYLLLKLH